MQAPASRRSQPIRRALFGLLAVLFPLFAPPLAAQPSGEPVLVVSRERVLQEAAAAESLNEAEAAMTEALQSRVDAIKAELAAEEQELTRLRSTLPRDQFERRVQSFDQRVRQERERTQRRAAALQTAFRDARRELIEALLPILVALSNEMGAKLVLDRDQILLAHPSIDVTDRAIAMMDERVTAAALPTLDELEPLPEPGADAPQDNAMPDPAEKAPAGAASE